MRNTKFWKLIISAAAITIAIQSCKHEPFTISPDDMTPMDTTVVNPPDTTGTNPVDTTGSANPCDSNLVYFDMQILPLLKSNCALSGCHDEATAAEGIILTSFEKVIQTGEIKPGDPQDSDLYERITEDDPDKRMPPPPNAALTQDQISLIREWIVQGAEDLTCEANNSSCNLDAVSFASDIQPVINTNCRGCHSGANASGGVFLDDYQNIASVAQSGRLYGAVAHLAGYEPMPLGAGKLPQCAIDQINAWIQAGTPNN
jgi:uncharacterized membrane protein